METKAKRKRRTIAAKPAMKRRQLRPWWFALRRQKAVRETMEQLARALEMFADRARALGVRAKGMAAIADQFLETASIVLSGEEVVGKSDELSRRLDAVAFDIRAAFLGEKEAQDNWKDRREKIGSFPYTLAPIYVRTIIAKAEMDCNDRSFDSKIDWRPFRATEAGGAA